MASGEEEGVSELLQGAAAVQQMLLCADNIVQKRDNSLRLSQEGFALQPATVESHLWIRSRSVLHLLAGRWSGGMIKAPTTMM